MSPHLVPISWKEFEKFLLFVGCVFQRQKSSHRIYTRSGLKRPVVVPSYGNVPNFVIRNNLRILNISTEEFAEVLKRL